MNKTVAYSVFTFVAFLTATLVTACALYMGWFMGIFIGIFAALCANVLTRMVWHLVKNDLSEAFLASEIWYAIYVGLFGWFVFNTSAPTQTSLVFVMLGCAVNALGFRFICKGEIAPVPEMEKKEPTKKEKVAELCKTLRYRFLEDGVTPNLDAPLCVDEDGRHLTPSEADAKGLGAQCAEAIEYIKTIV